MEARFSSIYIQIYMYTYIYIHIYTYIYILEKEFSTYLFCFMVYCLNLLLFRVTLSVHSKVCKVHLKITTLVDVIAAYDILKQI